MMEYTYITGYANEVAGGLNNLQKDYKIIEIIPLGNYIDDSQSAIFTVLVKITAVENLSD